MSATWPPRNVTVARVRAVEVIVNWRWVPVLVLGTWLLAQSVLPASFPSWTAGTNWLTSAAVVLAGEAALLLHELSHTVAARRNGQHVTRIVFHGFRAETIVATGLPEPAHGAFVALVGPGTNLALAGAAAIARMSFATQGPLDLLLLTLVLGNAAVAVMSLVPVPGSDGRRALNALHRGRSKELDAEVAGQRQNQDDQDHETERRPAVIAPAARMAEATAK